MELARVVGQALGALLAPVTGVGAWLRQARFFHPEGVVYRAEVRPALPDGPLAEVGERLSGPAIARLSGAWWRGGKEWIDVLGFALRFGVDPGAPHPEEPPRGSQDLLFATIRQPWTTPFAPLTTDPRSFSRNDYYAVSPFEVEGFGRAKLRLVAPDTDPGGPGDRQERLRIAAARGLATFGLEIKEARLGRPWLPLATVQLIEPITIDQAALRFSPYRAGRGIEPRGVVHAMRIPAYGASQGLRPH